MIDGKMVIDVPLDKEVHKQSKASKRKLYEIHNRGTLRLFFKKIIKRLPKELICFPILPYPHSAWTDQVIIDVKNAHAWMVDSLSDVGNAWQLKHNIPAGHKRVLSIEKEITDCINKKYRFICMQLFLSFKKGAHANLILMDTKRKEVELFEPHGGYNMSKKNTYEYDYDSRDKPHYNKVSAVIKQFFKIFVADYKYISPKEFLPKHELQGKVSGPYCLTWCMLYLHYKLLNKDIPSKTIIKRMKQIDKTFLLRYMKFMENTIKNRKTKYKSKPIKTV